MDLHSDLTCLNLRLTGCRTSGYLWTIPAQRASWQRVAAEQGGQGRYRDFCSLLVNDINFLMDAAIEHLKEARRLEGQQEDQAAWNALNPEARSDAQDNLESAREHPPSYLSLRCVIF